ncbi:type I DNA topoisomerase [Pelagibius sp.]|uniref:type I DNA topoisomerase n=1 Tax=Pelagibius sp. TaxID=1931238 RepID=UPI0026043DA0|nr:type I DNA topoisomerase [Pelagibius sp.]
MNVVIVESPAKAKTINKYLGKDYHVLASYGHVRDLPAKDGSVRPDEDFSMSWQVDERGEKRLREIAAAVKDSKHLFLATDPDREGEAISWHIVDELRRRKVLDGVDVERVVFNEITQRAIAEAFDHPRSLNQELIDAYMARRALDYLVGFTLSPVLWRKLPGSRSAGRVQSVALRLVSEREAEIEAFKPQEYWSIDVTLANSEGASFVARLTHLEGTKLDRFDLGNESAAMAAVAKLEAASELSVDRVERKQTKRNPYPPFTTSTLQQEASRKLGFGATRTMRVAQKLYEGIDLGGEAVGLITYMRTDGVQMAEEALEQTRALIASDYGDPYLPHGPRQYKSKAKNAQEAHEAIRPTDLFRRPKDVAAFLDQDGLKLYDLIWRRTVACQMSSAELDQVAVDVRVDAGVAQLRATGSVITFDGFLKIYQESKDEGRNGDQDSGNQDSGNGAGERRLPKLTEGEALRRQEVLPEQHFTQPPPRYSEASLVKKMEELGIGRPSTYASILQVLQDRNYVRLERRRFVPEDRGRLVVAFLSSFFERYVQYNFTAEMEERLDDISGGRADWRRVLHDFWSAFYAAVEGASGLSITQVIDALDEDLGPHFFPIDPKNPGKNPRECPACSEGRLGLRFSRNGGFIGCSNYPECRFTRPLAVPSDDADADGIDLTNPKLLGEDPETGKAITLRKGPFGIYLQIGEVEGDTKPKRSSLPKGLPPADVDLAKAIALLALPREVGAHPEDGKAVTAGIGRYGPYVKHGSTYRSLTEGDDVLTLGLNRAVALLAEAPKRGAAAGRPLGDHPDDGKPVTQGKGRFGPYVKHLRLYASIPSDIDPESITLEQALPLLAAQAEKKAQKAAKKPAAKKKAASKKKAATKKAGKKKAASTKKAAKKAPARKKAVTTTAAD